MTQVFFVFALFLAATLTVNAQCSKSVQACAKKSASTASVEEKAAELVASADENIKREVCQNSGCVSYYQKSVCDVSGKESWEKVEFDASTRKFTKVASASMEKDPVTGEVKENTTKACAGKAEGKACAKGDAGKACCKSKKNP
jgi:hypothetical protein